MSEVLGRVDKLSPERRALLQKILRQQAAPAHEPDAILPREGGGPAPLSFAQERLWFIDRLEPGSAVYNIPVAWRLGGALDERALERSLGEIVRRHEALRTVFTEADGSPVQVVAPFGGFALPVEELSGLGEAEREAAVRRRAGEEARRAFDLSAGPLFRAALLRLGSEEHVLLLTMHHIVGDGWSTGVLFRELSALYAAYREGRESPLAELAVQYADYAVWQREQLAGEALDRQLAYWKERLAGAPELLELPTDHPRPPVQTYRGASVPVELSVELLERLQALALSEGATLYMVLLGAFQVLLSKYSGSDDIVVGSPIAGRTRREVEELIGFFVNTLVLRTDLGGDPSFRETLRRVREATLGAYAHQEVPFEKLVAELQPERSLSHSPLFQVLFTLQNAEGRGDALAGLEVRGIGAAMEIAKFDLSLTLSTTAQGLRGALSYGTDLFERGTAERMLGHLARVLEQVAADADVRLSRLELLGEAERALVVEEWNRTEAEYPADRCIHELFEAQAARTPGNVAVRFEAESLTYRELNERANRLAHHLVRRGVGPEVRVGICLERSLEMVVGILAVLKAGGAYVPLDPGYPAERLAFILADSATPVLLTRETLRGALPAREGVEVVSLDGAAEEIAAESAENPWSGAGPDSLAYVIYTSGSTGAPKGALIEHRNVARLFTATDPWFGFGPGDVWTLFHSYAFDFSVWELWGALLYGGRLVVVPELVSRDPEAFHALVRREGVTVLSQTPSAFRQFIRVDGERGGELALRVVVFGGEALEPASLREWVERRGAGTPRLVNMYGITETTVHVTYRPLTEADVFGGSGSPIGVRIPDLRLYVCDSALRPLPVGVPGELYVGGGGVARGYLNRPELTAQRFVENPFGAGTLYRTGDRVRWLADGTLDYLGRLDEQVKIRGFRIELGEIEARLAEHPEVREAVVLAREDAPGEKRLVAYVVGDVEAGVLREHLRRELPEYMVPAAFVALERLPLTANGKLDRKALPAPEGDAYARGSYEAPLGEVEAALAEIWAEMLGLERVGRWDHFFELGGHSLLAIKLVERMRRAGLHTDVRALFTTPVLAELARVVGRESSGLEIPANGIAEGCGAITPEMLPLVELTVSEIERIVAEVPGGAANVQDIYPLAPLQEGILFHHLLSQEGDPYLLSSVTEFDTRAHLEQYLAALQAVVDRHDILRTAVAWEGLREPVQVVWRHAPLPVEEVELDAEAQDAAGELWRRFDPRRYRMELGRAPLLRACIAEDRARGRWLLLLLTHHLTSDHESLEVQREEISAHLLGLESELPAPLPFRNYVAQARLGVSREEHERFFGTMLGDVEEPTAPYGLLDVWGEGRGMGEAWLPVASDVAARLRRRARALGVSAASLCHLAWAQVLARLSGQTDVVFGTLLFGRMQGGEGTDRVMGPFINTLPVRIGVGEEGVEAAVRRTHALLAELLRHEHASLSLAQRCSGVEAPAPLFTSLLNYRYGGGTRRSREAATEGVRGLRGQERTNYPVALSVNDRGEEFSLVALVAAPAEAERVCRMMHTALERLVEALELAPGRAIGSIDVLPEAERRTVLEAWNGTAAEVPADRCIHELFEVQAARTPGAVAVRFEAESLTYAELNARANQLAHHLRGRGVGPEVRVGVLMERSLEMVVSLLAVLKAGGAYVPLDPGLPAERVAYMLGDSAVPLVLVQAGLRGAVPEGVEVLAVDALAERLAAEPAENPAGGAGPDSLAYVIYTSGSTGRPKGVMNAHRGVVNRLVWMQAHFGIGTDDVVLQKTPFGFDVSVWEFFWPLQRGACLVMARPDGHRDPAYLRDVVEREGVTTLHFVPSMLQPFVEAVEAGRCASLRHVVCSGEALPPALVRRFHDRFAGPVVLTNLYGPTEAAVDVSCWTCPRDGADGVVPIGGPVWNTTLYVLDAALRPVPVGAPGELYIGGVQVARGYLGRAALTAERFVPDPFSARGGARLYRTGDRARWRADGAIEYLGRLDFQVKIRGFRIELGEIEAVLLGHPGVREAVVLAREDVPGDRRLVAYLVPDPARAAGVLELQRLEREAAETGPRPYELPNGMGIVHLNAAETRFLYREIFEDRSYLRHGVALGDGACVFDVGANIGLFTLFAGTLRPGVTVYAFEPIPPVFAALEANARIHGVDARLFNCGVGSTAGVETFTFYPHASVLSGRQVDEDEARSVVRSFVLNEHDPGAGGMDGALLEEMLEARLDTEQVTCEIRTLSQVIREQGVERIDLLKVDVEGGEYDVLAGIEEEHWERIAQVVAEARDQDLERVTELLARHGFAIAVEQEHGLEGTGLHTLYAVRPQAAAGEPAAAAAPARRWSTPSALTRDLRGLGRERLPEYMVPAAYVYLEALPLTPNGKLDRKALPAPELASAEDRSVAPRTPAEEVLAGIWAEVLGREQVGVEESFFALGGHSLLGTRVVSRVRELFGVELPLRALFEGPTVAELAGRVEEMRRAGLPVLPPVAPAERTGALPLSFAQERLWFLDRLEPGSATYNIPAAWRLGGVLDQAALERALGEIVRRHEALRTVFANVDGSPVQVIAPFGGFALPVEDLSGWSETDREAAFRRRAGEEARRAFDLSAGPLFRAALLRLHAEDHVLLVTMHHIVSDGWSMGVLQRELSALYTAYREGRESPLPALPVQYADYAVWQRGQLAGEVLERQLAYWRERLAGAPELLELPTDRPRPPVQTYRGASVPVELSPELLERLQALGRSEGTTLYMTLLGAFQVLLSTYGGSDDIVVGSPIAGRTRREVEELIGFFVNTVVLRTDLSGDPSFRETLRRVREATLGAYAHQEVPFEKLVAELQPERSLSHSPLFQVMFTLQDAGGGGGALPGLKVAGVGAAMEIAKFDLSLTLAATPQGLRGGLNYSTDLFERGTVERMLGHLARVLEQVAADADVRLSRLELLGEAERSLVLDAWNRTAAEVPADRCIHEMFEVQAARTPGAVAVRFEAESLTYRELNERANRLAHHLVRLGVGPEVRVGVLMERSLEMVVSLLAVLKAGGAYVPLDPGLPAERLAYMLGDSAVPLVLVQAALRGAVPEGVGVLAVDALAERLAAEPAENPAGGAGPDSLAYVIYTSGSTGRPKGVMNAHRGVVNRLVWMQAHFGIGAHDAVLQKTPFGFDVSVWEFFWPLQQGACLVMARPDGHRDPAYLRDVVEREGVTTLHFVPSMLQPFVEAVEAGRCASLRHVVCSGEALPPALVRRFHDRFAGPVVLTNLYGPTEAAVDVSCWTCPRDGADGVVPIGGPVWNTTLYVLDAALRPVPVGAPGELYIGGVQVARGYLGRAALTAERFVPDPFSARGGARLYRTGDRARWRADGAIEYLGRLDFQVKIRGFRIELGEIEAVLLGHPGVHEAVVVARAEAGEQRLVAYVVGDVEAGVLREHLRRELPEYMVPAAFVALERLPLTANGKLDRKALPAPEGDAYARGSYEAPLGEVEAALAEIWGEMLGLERVGRWDHFFELGGHSLLAIKLIERMRRRGLHTDVRALFTTPVLAELALAVGRESPGLEIPANGIPEGCGAITPEMLPLVELSPAEIDRIVAGVPGGAANVQDIYPLAPLQEGILFHHLLSQEGDPYLLSSMAEFDTRVRLEQYLAALQAVIDRHDVLRTAVAWEGLSEPVQVVWRHAPLPVEEVALDAEAEDAAGELWRRFDPRRYRMELGRAPLRRACIAEDRARGRWLLLLLTHHLTSDHESLEVQREEISAHLRGREAELPAPLPFRNYVAQARLGVSREEHERFFGAMLGDVEEPTAPYGLLDVRGEGHGIGEARLPLAGDVAARLRRRARALGVSAASLCHLAWAQVLARVSGRQDVVFGTLLFGRMQGGEGADRVMGPLINTLPVRIGVGEEGVEAAVRRTHALLAELLRHEHASLSLAQRCSGVAAPAPLFTSLLNYRYGGGTKRSREAGQATEGVRGIRGQERTSYPVALAVDDLGEEFSLVAQVAAPADAERVCRMMHTALERLVEALEASPARAIGSIDVLPEAERRTVLEAWNRTEAEYRRDVCVHELFEAQVERTPGAVALVFENEEVTYAELNARANQLAHHLGGLGVGPEARVALCVERGIEMVVAVLAVLKAGGAYVPLDPEYPGERLRYMLQDSAPVVLLTQRSLSGRFDGSGVPIEVLDGDASAWSGQSDSNPRHGALTPQNLAYVIYTSGSTGRPKGVMNGHRGVINLLAWGERHWGLGAGDAVLQRTSLSFDVSVRELFSPLLAGARLVIVRPGGQREVDYLVEVVRRREVSTMILTVSHMQAFLEHPGLEGCSSLRRIVLGGESIPVGMVAELRARLPGARLYHEYGPTETSVTATVRSCGAEGEAPGASIGGPISNARVYLLDARGEPVPVGVAGELYVGGAGVARGYLGRPALTAERFVPDPFGAEPGERLYRTGDLGRWLPDGTIEFLGRVDTQVKVRGYRIEPGEIEARLREREGVSEAVVVAHQDEAGNRRLVAYVVGGVEAESLREHLRRKLPDYMVPAAFVPLERLPLTPSGKLDRRALPAPELARAEERYVAPRTLVEEVLAELWAEMLRLERVGVTESFFELGGHSLLATRVVSRVRQVFGVEVPLRALFEGPTVAELAERVEEIRRAGAPALPPVVPAERTGALPLSFAQERLWFIDRLEPGSAVYNLPVARRLEGALDQAALERALGEIVRRHEALRTVFAEADGSPVQVIAPFGGFALPVEDLSGLAEADREAAVRRRAGEEAARPFDLSAGPLFRAKLLRLGEEDHLLLLSMHHVVSDGWSMGVLFRELSALYAAYREGRESPLPELPVQYADYAVWQRGQLEGEVLDRQLAYWRDRLSGAPELLELPTDRPRPAVQTYRGATVPVDLPPELLERLQALGRREGATLYMTLLAAFQVLLGKYAGSEDVVVGSPIAGRTRGEVEELIGFFVNTLVLRTDLSGDPSFRELLGRVREATLGAYAHQELPFEKLVVELQPERSLSHSPLFQALFALQNAAIGGGALPGLKVGGIGAGVESAKFDLSLTLAATPQGLRGGLNYSTDLFERATVERMLGHLERVLEQVAADADVRLSRLELLGGAEREQVLGTWNRTERESSDPPAHALFAEWARRAPGATALLHGREAVSYGALDRRAAALARRLRELGVGPETPVGLCMERTPELLVGVLGIWKAGGAYVPLDPGYPAERLGWIIADAALQVVVATGDTAGVLPEHGATLVRVDQLPETEAAPEVPASDTGLAYVIYTSGSTGKPKGVLVQHGSLSNLLAATREAFGVGEGDVMPALASYAFDIWLFEALLPLTSGAAVRLVGRERVMDVPALVTEIADSTLVHAVPALMRQLVHAERETPRFTRLRRAFVGGDRVAADLLAEMREALPGAETHVLYGPTEGTILASTHPVPADGIVAGHPIGRPLGNVRLYVCDGLGSPQPAGVPGELLIGGAGVARGYLGRAGLTAERFVPDPFGTEPGARLYRTGDRARWRTDGTLEYLGRLDGQVKIRGFRIEPGEIEAVLRGHERVTECVVVAREDVPGDRRLVAYVVGGVEADELREHLRGSLPEYMLPSAFVALDRLPLTPNGKLDRKALPAPDFASAENRYVAPRTPTEEVLAGIWAEVLRLERVGVEESFFDLGGHSLLATRVVSRVSAVFGVELPLRALFEGPTVAELAVRVEELRRAGLPVLPPVVPNERTGALPLSFAQERLWFLDRLEPGSATYNIPTALRLTGPLDEPALERSLSEIVRRHEALRTVFGEVDGSPVQVIAPFGGFALPREDLSGWSDTEREAALRRRAREETARPFDLAAGPLFRAALLRLGAEDHVLLLSMHHIVSDGWSTGVLFRELSALYAAYREGRESPLAELAVQYADYAVWQREQLAGEVLDRQLAYWKERLVGAPELLELPTDRPRPAAQTYRGATVPVELSPELLERLQALGRGEGATLYMTLLGAFQVLLSKYAGSEDVVVGSPIAGRTRAEVEELIGLFVNTLVLRTDLSGDPSFRETLRRVREATLGAYAHQELPFEKLVAELQPERSLSHSPLFQVMFTLQNAGGGGAALPGLGVSGVGAAMESAKFDLSLTLSATAQGLRGGLNYNTDLFERGTVERMVGHLERVLEQATADADVRLSRLELLGETERALVVEEWNRTDAEYPAGACVHELFEAQAERTPGAVAVRFEDESLTYAQLNARANRLAHHLAGLGAGPEARVGICVERSAEMVVAMLAVLKSGAAYLPLDPSYPADRLAYMLEDSGAPLLVTQRSLRGVLPADGVRIVSVDEDATAIAANSADAPRTPVGAANAAYVIYTSGSTGKPKGVQVTHGNVVSFFAGMDERVGGSAAGTWLAVTRISFDIHVLELLWPLARGFRVVVQPEPDRARDGESIAEQIRRHAVTHLQCTPSLAAMLIAESGTGVLSGLERILLGGEALPSDLAAQITAVLPNGLVNMYGPTETTVWSATHAVDVGEGPIAIGRPIANTRVYVLDAALRPQPAGVPGELFIGGHGVTRGYLGRPGLTAERFVPDAFSAEPGARLYRTGDRARWKKTTGAEVRECASALNSSALNSSADVRECESAFDSPEPQRTSALTHSRTGVLEYLGRLDAQVKVRGFRIEPGEIEAVLRRHPGVVECAVVARAAGSGDTRLVAYVVGAAEADELRTHAGRSLPDYMVPGAFVSLDALPLTPNGKLDRKALPAPGGSSFATRVYEAPRTEAERKVAAVWAGVLGVENVGAHDRFFDLGGHSLLLVRVQARLREAFGQAVPITHLFRYLTVSALAAALEAPAPQPAAAPADDARVRDGRHRLRARGRAGVTGSRGDA